MEPVVLGGFHSDPHLFPFLGNQYIAVAVGAGCAARLDIGFDPILLAASPAVDQNQ